MHDDSLTFVIVILIGCIIAFPPMMVNSSWKQDTIERGLAIYCPSDGRWAWIGECESK